MIERFARGSTPHTSASDPLFHCRCATRWCPPWQCSVDHTLEGEEARGYGEKCWRFCTNFRPETAPETSFETKRAASAGIHKFYGTILSCRKASWFPTPWSFPAGKRNGFQFADPFLQESVRVSNSVLPCRKASWSTLACSFSAGRRPGFQFQAPSRPASAVG